MIIYNEQSRTFSQDDPYVDDGNSQYHENSYDDHYNDRRGDGRNDHRETGRIINMRSDYNRERRSRPQQSSYNRGGRSEFDYSRPQQSSEYQVGDYVPPKRPLTDSENADKMEKDRKSTMKKVAAAAGLMGILGTGYVWGKGRGREVQRNSDADLITK